MAFARKNKSVVETNHVSAVRTGNIKAQHKATVDMENGMAVVVDEANKSVALAGPKVDLENIYLHVSEEQLYESHLGRNDFYIKKDQYPRCLKLVEGDVFETNALVAGEAITYAKGNKLTADATGFWRVAASTEFAIAEIVEMVTLPNGEAGAKIQIVKQSTVA